MNTELAKMRVSDTLIFYSLLKSKKKKKKTDPGTLVSVQQSMEQKYIFPHMTANKCLRKAQVLS